MDDTKAQLLRWIDEDREAIVAFLCDFVRAKSPNPPGDTTLAAAHVTRFLTLNQLPFRVIAPQATMPNIVGSFEGARPGHDERLARRGGMRERQLVPVEQVLDVDEVVVGPARSHDRVAAARDRAEELEQARLAGAGAGASGLVVVAMPTT